MTAIEKRLLEMLPHGATVRIASAIRSSGGRDTSAVLSYALSLEVIEMLEQAESRLVARIRRLTERVRELEDMQ